MKQSENCDKKMNDERIKTQSMCERRGSGILKRILFRFLFALLVAAGAYIILTSNKGGGGSSVNCSDEPSHQKIDYLSFVEGDAWAWALSENTKISMKLSKAFPQGKKIKFRFEGRISLDEKIMPIEVVLATVPKITNGEVNIGEIQLESCDLNDEAATDKKDFKDLPMALYALMKGDVKFVGVPLYCNATEIISMTTAEMLVK